MSAALAGYLAVTQIAARLDRACAMSAAFAGRALVAVLLVFGVGACVVLGTYLVRTDWGDQ